MSTKYRILIAGVRDGFAKERLVINIARRFSLTEEEVRPYFNAPTFLSADGTDFETATKLKAALEELGAVCSVEPEQTTVTSLPPTKACQFCGEQILAVAKKCKHCQTMLDGTLSDPGRGSVSEETEVDLAVHPGSYSAIVTTDSVGTKRNQLFFIVIIGSLFLIVYLLMSRNSDLSASSTSNTKPLSSYDIQQIFESRSLAEKGKLEEAKAIANIYKDRSSVLVSDLNKKIEEAEQRVLINQAEQLLKDGKADDGMKILAPMVQANKPDALRVVNEHKQRVEDDKLPPLPPQAFPIAEQASLSTATKFSSYLGKKYLVFDLSGASVDDLKKEGDNYYIDGVRDFATNEYVSQYNIKFFMNSNLAKEFYKILPESGKGMVHYRFFCLPRFTAEGLVRTCEVIKYQQFNVGGTMIHTVELKIEEAFNASKRSRQKEILKIYFEMENVN